MQGQRGANNLFGETVDLNQGTVLSNNGSNPPTGWNSMLYPMENHNVLNFNSWHIGESSSSSNPNLQSQGLSGNVRNESPFDNIGSLSRPLNGSSRTPLNINLNADDMEIDDPFPYNIENNDDSSSSFDDWGSSVKRKDLDTASSNYFQQGETFSRHDIRRGSSNLDAYTPHIHPPSFSHSEELNLRIGIGRGTSTDPFSPISVTETGESSSRNYGVRINHDNNPFNIPSTRNNTSSSDFFDRRQASRPISPPDTFEFRPFSSNVRTHTPNLQRTMPPFASQIGGERGLLSRDGGNGMEHSPFARFPEIRNNRNSSPENIRNPVTHVGSPWTPPPPHGLSRNVQRSPQLSPFQFSSEESMMTSGENQGRHRNLPSFRSEARELPGDDVSGWHALAADIEGRQRLVSDIRHVLNAMRRGDNLRDEDYMLFDPFINGVAELHDRHRDMRLDVDNMSYEELLALEERIGDVNTGLSEEAILRSLKQRKLLCLFSRSSSTVDPCSICRDEYVMGDNVGELDCGHDFHTDCIKQWLRQKNICPICKMTALGT